MFNFHGGSSVLTGTVFLFFFWIFYFLFDRFSIAWWASAFPMTVVAIASIRYIDEEQSSIFKIMAIVFSVISMTVIGGVLVIATVIHYFLYGHRVIPLGQCLILANKKKKLWKINCLPSDVRDSKFFVQNPNFNVCSKSYRTHNLVFTDTHSYTIQRQFEFFTARIKADGIAIAKIVMATANVYSLFNMQEKKMNRFDLSK